MMQPVITARRRQAPRNNTAASPIDQYARRNGGAGVLWQKRGRALIAFGGRAPKIRTKVRPKIRKYVCENLARHIAYPEPQPDQKLTYVVLVLRHRVFRHRLFRQRVAAHSQTPIKRRKNALLRGLAIWRATRHNRNITPQKLVRISFFFGVLIPIADVSSVSYFRRF